MNIEELAFKNIEELSQEDELILYDIIDFLQKDRKQWINQFSKTHNENVELQQKVNQLEWELDSRTNYYNDAKDLYFKARDKVTQLEEKEELHLNRIDELTDRVVKLETNRDEVIEVIDKMIHKGWGINGYYYDATGEASEFGARGRRIQQLLERGKE